MKPLTIAIFVIGSFAAGLYFGQRPDRHVGADLNESARAPICEATPANCAEMESFKSSLKGISPEEIRQYLKTQDADQKLKKADEILGKIMQLLVAQVGFRLEPSELNQFGKIPARVDNQPPPASVPKSETKTEAATSAPLRKPRFTVGINAARSESDAQRVLNSMGANFSERLQQSGTLTPDEVQNLIGDFEGVLTFDKDHHMNRLEMSFQGQIVNRRLQGNWSYRAFDENNKQVSNSTGRGNLSRDFSGDENEIFMEVGSAYMQLVYFPGLDQWMGNYLESSRGQYNKIGFAILRRK